MKPCLQCEQRGIRWILVERMALLPKIQKKRRIVKNGPTLYQGLFPVRSTRFPVWIEESPASIFPLLISHLGKEKRKCWVLSAFACLSSRLSMVITDFRMHSFLVCMNWISFSSFNEVIRCCASWQDTWWSARFKRRKRRNSTYVGVSMCRIFFDDIEQ